MATRVTRWSPDTCGCVLEYEWDDAVDVDARVHVPCAPVSVCSTHAVEADPHAAAEADNKIKNQLVAQLKGAEADWHFEGRRLVVRVHDATPAVQRRVQRAAAKLGDVEVRR